MRASSAAVDVVLAVGQVLEDRGHRLVLGRRGQPDPCAEAAAVAQRDPDGIEDGISALSPTGHRPPAAVLHAGPEPAVIPSGVTAIALTRLNGSSPGVTAWTES